MPTETSQEAPNARRKVLVIDDSQMLLGFAKEVLTGANYEVLTAASAQQGLDAAAQTTPDLILLDYVLPDMKGVDVSARLRDNGATARVPIIYMTGFGSRVEPGQISGNVIASLNKPFTSDLLKRTIEQHMPKESFSADQSPAPTAVESAGETPAEAVSAPTIDTPHPPDAGGSIAETTEVAVAAGQTSAPWWAAPATAPEPSESAPAVEPIPSAETEAPATEFATPPTDFAPVPLPLFESEPQPTFAQQPHFAPEPAVPLPVSANTFFSGETTFFTLHWALQTIGKQRLTGTLRCLWDRATVELLARKGEIVLVTTSDAELYCPEAPITLVNIDAAQTAAARDQQRQTSCPMFITLAEQGLVLREPAMQLVEHYGQKLFSQLWTASRVRFVFELSELPAFANDVPGEDQIDQWGLSTLRFIQYQELRGTPEMEASCIPAYTKDGYLRVQKLRLTVAEAQFASQFNGARSIAQIAKNLRLDIKFARLTLFRFLALEIVECWPPMPQAKQERRGFFQRVGSLVGLGD